MSQKTLVEYEKAVFTTDNLKEPASEQSDSIEDEKDVNLNLSFLSPSTWLSAQFSVFLFLC